MLQSCSIIKVAGVFFNEPTKSHYLMEISQKSGLAHTSVMKYLQELKRLKIIRESSEKKGKRTFPLYWADLDGKGYKKYKRICSLLKLEGSGLIDFLRDKLMPKAIVLFGSYARGEDIEDSDIDLFLECKKEVLDLSAFEKKLHRKISLHFKENFKEYSTEIKNNIINGLVLSGYLGVFK